MKRVANRKIRELIKSKGYTQWEASEFLQIGESVLSRLLRKELEPEQSQKLISKLNELEERK